MIHILKEGIALREGGPTVFDKVEGLQLTKGRQEFLDLMEGRGKRRREGRREGREGKGEGKGGRGEGRREGRERGREKGREGEGRESGRDRVGSCKLCTSINGLPQTVSTCWTLETASQNTDCMLLGWWARAGLYTSTSSCFKRTLLTVDTCCAKGRKS